VGGRGSGKRLGGGDGRGAERGALLRRRSLRLAVCVLPDDRAFDARTAHAVQGPRVVGVTRELPGRPDVPGDLPRRCRRADGGTPSRLRRDTGGRRAGRGPLRLPSSPPALVGGDRPPALPPPP